MNAEKRTLLHKLLWALVPYNGLVAFIAFVDFVMNPMALSPYAPFGGAAWFRAYCVSITPLYFLLAYLVLRKSRNNLIGLFLFAFSGGALSFGVSVEIDPVLYNLVSLLITLWWTILILMPLYFPDGKAFPRRLSRYLTLLFCFALVAGFVNQSSFPTLPLAGSPANPWYIPALSGVNNVVTGVYFVGMLPMLPLVFISPFVRYRRADYQQRQQLKWLLLFGGAFVPYLVMYFGAGFLYDNETRPDWFVTVYNGYLLYIVAFPALAIGNAILRHKLYEIDIIIRRTLLYAVLSVILATIYFGGVILTQQLLRAFIGQSGGDLGIVLSTLLIAALFSPLRRRIQDIIDRRFYRRKYDAEQTLARFNQTLRDEVDIETLKAQLVGVVNDTMQPTKITLWVREE